ncbi:hypothetical protein GCM10009741_18270 [Kribbella lupini]|uniref:Uncharacterized protein n=1 Tax=Kribbella lupini TaxID=291602 RepID=A0ABN2AGB9_9ACTN
MDLVAERRAVRPGELDPVDFLAHLASPVPVLPWVRRTSQYLATVCLNHAADVTWIASPITWWS